MINEKDIILEVRDLTVEFGSITGASTRAVDEVSFDLRRGQTLAIVGESGSGKSVTAYSLLRLIQSPGRIAGGRITLSPKGEDKIDITSLNDRSPLLYKLRGGYIGMIFQEPMTALSPVIPVGKQVAEVVRLHRSVNRREAERLTIEMFGRVGIPEPERRIRQYSFEFSGGMRQRVVIAMALIGRPQILIADEPTTALDVTIQAQILELIRELKDDFESSVIFITHDLGVVAQIADEVMVMNKARVMEQAGVYDLYDEPLHPYTRRLLAAMPRLDAEGGKLAIEIDDRINPAGLSHEYTLSEAEGEGDSFLVKVEPGRRLRVWRRQLRDKSREGPATPQPVIDNNPASS